MHAHIGSRCFRRDRPRGNRIISGQTSEGVARYEIARRRNLHPLQDSQRDRGRCNNDASTVASSQNGRTCYAITGGSRGEEQNGKEMHREDIQEAL